MPIDDCKCDRDIAVLVPKNERDRGNSQQSCSHNATTLSERSKWGVHQTKAPRFQTKAPRYHADCVRPRDAACAPITTLAPARNKRMAACACARASTRRLRDPPNPQDKRRDTGEQERLIPAAQALPDQPGARAQLRTMATHTWHQARV